MKIVEKVLERRMRCMVKVDKMQFGFMPGKGTIDAVFILRRLQEEHLDKEKSDDDDDGGWESPKIICKNNKLSYKNRLISLTYYLLIIGLNI